jgi:hypothetical protein
MPVKRISRPSYSFAHTIEQMAAQSGGSVSRIWAATAVDGVFTVVAPGNLSVMNERH